MSAKTLQGEAGSVNTAKAVILYDDAQTLLSVKPLVERAGLRPGNAVAWDVHSWPFDMLGLTVGLEPYRALEEAADADLVVVAIRAPLASADSLTDWLGYWAGLRRLRDAQLIVMPCGLANGAEIKPLLDQLHRLAEVRRLPFSVFSRAPSSGGPAKGVKGALKLWRSAFQQLAQERAASA